MSTSIEQVLAQIDKDELVRLALTVCNIDSAGPAEAAVANYVADWLEAEGFNVLGRLAGSGGGCSLIFNSHMDTSVRATDIWSRVDPEAAIHHKAWLEGDELVGEGIVNDKGPMVAFLIAGKAIKKAGMVLKGDLLLSAVVGETSHEPSDGPPGALIETKDLGARFLATHGGIADYALIAEGTGFSIVTVEAGMAWYKVTWRSDQPAFYVPYLPDRTSLEQSPNMIVRAAAGIASLERWAADYQKRYTRELGGGRVIPKAQIGAIRGGNPNSITSTPQICSIYVGAFIVPGQDPLILREEIAASLEKAGVPASDIELYLFKPGYEAKNADRLAASLRRAHEATFGEAPPSPDPPTCSMWRDINPFNEIGVPAITYGPRSTRHSYRRSFTIDALYKTSCVYARVIADLCNQDKRR